MTEHEETAYQFSIVRRPGGVRALLMEPGGADDVFVSRYSAANTFLMDTWFATVKEAMNAASEEFGIDKSEWQDVPASSIAEAEAYLFRRMLGIRSSSDG